MSTHPFLTQHEDHSRQKKLQKQKKKKQFDVISSHSPLRSLQSRYSPGRIHIDKETNSKKNNKGKPRFGHIAFELAKIFLFALIVIMPIRVFLFQPFFVKGASMEPNFSNGQYLLINELGYKQTRVGLGDFTLFTVVPTKELNRGDVIVFRLAGTKDFFIKRIIALPGETVEISDGDIYVTKANEDTPFELLESGYLAAPQHTTCRTEKCAQPVHLGDNEFYVLGDNRSASSDSREFGPVARDIVIGKALLRAWPVTEFTLF